CFVGSFGEVRYQLTRLLEPQNCPEVCMTLGSWSQKPALKASKTPTELNVGPTEMPKNGEQGCGESYQKRIENSFKLTLMLFLRNLSQVDISTNHIGLEEGSNGKNIIVH
ncbi:hypothetical protein RJ641_002792, partial [Dillenia turbinata]